ncbi:MAG: FHA domain-containing protein [Actinomycetaceae bacterium]|nr:FHA domain-containing protein [Actinomycetaceae bacterium]
MVDNTADAAATAVFGAGVQESDAAATALPLSRVDQEAVAALPPGSALLIVQRGPNAGSRFLLDTPRTSVGRHPGSDIFFDDVTVSRKHCEFLASEGGEGYSVRDAGSLNGTYVNRDRIDHIDLKAGDEVQVGKYRLTYHPSPAQNA